MRKLPLGKKGKAEKALWEHMGLRVAHWIRLRPFLEESEHSLPLMMKRHQVWVAVWIKVAFCGSSGLYKPVTVWLLRGFILAKTGGISQ